MSRSRCWGSSTSCSSGPADVEPRSVSACSTSRSATLSTAGPGLDQALGRWVGYGSFLGLFAIVPVLGRFSSLAELIWVLALLATTARSPTKQGLHDRFANTALVRPSSRASSGPAMACLIILVLLGVLFVIAVVALIFLGSQVGPLLRPPGTTI